MCYLKKNSAPKLFVVGKIVQAVASTICRPEDNFGALSKIADVVNPSHVKGILKMKYEVTNKNFIFCMQKIYTGLN